MMSLSSFSLKGSGWYATDYAGKKSAAAAKKEKTETIPASTESAAVKEIPAASTSSKED